MPLSIPPTFKIGLVQMRCALEPEANRAKAESMAREAAQQGAQVVCLPELFCTQYFCREENVDTFNLAESIPGPTTDRFARLAAELNVVIIAGMFERRAPGLYHNTAAVLGANGELHGLYRKMHIPDDPSYYEKFYFTPGDLGFPTFDTRYARIGIQICWDQWYPEGARATTLGGALALFYPTAIGWHPHEKEQYGPAQLDAWRTVQRGHAIANGVYLAAVNRVGFEGTPQSGLEFWGSSFVADPFGQIIAEASSDKEEILVAECSVARCEQVRRWWPFFRDRRIDAYNPLLQRWRD